MLHGDPPSNFNPRFEVVSCFMIHDGKILLLHRLDSDDMQPDVWGLPAGKREVDETMQTGILREVQEETGLVVSEQEMKFHESLYVRYPEYDFVYHAFSTSYEEKPKITLSPAEHKDYRWVTPQEALQMKLILDLDECIKRYFKISE